jgi:hypothetical protein
MTPDPLAAALDQLAAHHEHISRLDAREAAHFATLNGHLTQLTDMITHRTSNGPDDADRYQPGAPPAWWKLTPDQRREPAAQLRAWVEQVYRPGYGHLAATMAPCWEAHDLCLYGLDILSQLWSALYLQPSRSTGLLSTQAEYQARILPALAGQLMTETTSCTHQPARRPPTGYPQSAL